MLPPGDYGVVTDEELIEGLSFSAYHRISTVMFVPAQSGSAIEMVTTKATDRPVAEIAGNPARNSPRMAMTTVVPANSTA